MWLCIIYIDELSVMVWGGICFTSKTRLIFVRKDLKVKQSWKLLCYLRRRNVLTTRSGYFSRILFRLTNQDWCKPLGLAFPINGGLRYFLDRPLVLFSSHGLRCLIMEFHLPSCCLVLWSAKLHINWEICFSTSCTLVVALIHLFVSLSTNLIPNIPLCIALCVFITWSIFPLVSAHVWYP